MKGPSRYYHVKELGHTVVNGVEEATYRLLQATGFQYVDSLEKLKGVKRGTLAYTVPETKPQPLSISFKTKTGLKTVVPDALLKLKNGRLAVIEIKTGRPNHPEKYKQLANLMAATFFHRKPATSKTWFKYFHKIHRKANEKTIPVFTQNIEEIKQLFHGPTRFHLYTYNPYRTLFGGGKPPATGTIALFQRRIANELVKELTRGKPLRNTTKIIGYAKWFVDGRDSRGEYLLRDQKALETFQKALELLEEKEKSKRKK